jgi:glycogen debranching enzyme
VIRASGAFFTNKSLTFRVALAPGEVWRTEINVMVGTARAHPVPKREHQPEMPASMEEWRASAPRLDTDCDNLCRAYERSLVDLAALRFYPDSVPQSSLPAAGLPWYMALFGRDSLITSYQTLPFVPELCRTTLRALAAQQAEEFDDFRDAEPGKIMHELRQGELTYFGQRPHSPYYGSADSTPLFLVVLDEYERWTGDIETVRELEGAARAALRWIEEYGDANRDGFIEYQTRNPDSGLANHCWKDSANSIVHPDGRLASLPRSCCEIQGYAYDARRRTARLARECWGDPALADRLERDAKALRDSFNEAFWLADGEFYALALDGQGKRVATLASNMGHLLWSGIVPEQRVDALVGHLFDERMFSGWGVRTMASRQVPYNPLEYHNGTVWPHDNSLIAAGLVNYGRHEEAARIADALLEAAPHFGHCLPEALVGAARHVAAIPVAYPSACVPQAWACATPLMLLRSMLGLQPGPERLEVVDPLLPHRIGFIALRGIPGRWGRADVYSG